VTGTYRVGFFDASGYGDASGYNGGAFYAPQYYDDKGTLESADDIDVSVETTTTGIDAELFVDAHVPHTITPTAGMHGTITPSTPQTVEYGNGMTFSILTAPGYHIVDVLVDGDSVGAVSSYEFTNVTSNRTISATFAINNYTLKYAAGSHGTISSGSTSQTVSYNGNGTAVTASPSTGYYFVNWSDGSTANPRTDSAVKANVNVTANFANTYTLKYAAGSNGTISSGSASQTVSYNGNGTAVTASPSAGYHFVNWSDGKSVNPRTDTAVKANVNVTANFAINTYALKYAAGSNGTISSGSTSQTVNYNSEGTAVAATPSTGYHFEKWSDGSTQNPRTDTAVKANVNVTASFAINTYTLKYAAGTGGSISSGVTLQTVNYNASGTAVTAAATTGYHFVNWSDGKTTATRTDSAVKSNIDVTANFAINTYTLKYAAGTGGSISSGLTSQTVNYNASGTAVTAAATTGYHFVNWSDGKTTATRTDSAVKSNIDVTANFAINTYTVTAGAATNGTITPLTQTVNFGSNSSTVTITPATGYHLVEAADNGDPIAPVDGSVAGTKEYKVVDVRAGHTITATFTINTYTLKYTAGDNGKILSGNTLQTVDYNTSGTSVEVTATADGYRFLRWSEPDNSVANPRVDTGVKADVDVTALFGRYVDVESTVAPAATAALIGEVTKEGTITVEALSTEATPPATFFEVDGSRFEVEFTGKVAEGSEWELTFPYDKDLPKDLARGITVQHFDSLTSEWETLAPVRIDDVKCTVTIVTHSLSPFVVSVPRSSILAAEFTPATASVTNPVVGTTVAVQTTLTDSGVPISGRVDVFLQSSVDGSSWTFVTGTPATSLGAGKYKSTFVASNTSRVYYRFTVASLPPYFTGNSSGSVAVTAQAQAPVTPKPTSQGVYRFRSMTTFGTYLWT
ncbi:MAG: InlB B-repeat-containing protein, partial [Coriobacteriia bacterium]